MRTTIVVPEGLMGMVPELADSMGTAALTDAAGNRYALVSEPDGTAILAALPNDPAVLFLPIGEVPAFANPTHINVIRPMNGGNVAAEIGLMPIA